MVLLEFLLLLDDDPTLLNQPLLFPLQYQSFLLDLRNLIVDFVVTLMDVKPPDSVAFQNLPVRVPKPLDLDPHTVDFALEVLDGHIL